MAIPDGTLIEKYFSLPIPCQRMTMSKIISMSSYEEVQHIYKLSNHCLAIDIICKLPMRDALHVFSYLDAKSLSRASNVNRKWHELANNDGLWYLLCLSNDWVRYGDDKSIIKSIPSRQVSAYRIKNLSFLNQHSHNSSTLPLSRWKEVYIRADSLNTNWVQGHYSVLPLLKGHSRRVNTFDSANNILLSGAEDGSVLVWDVAAQECKFKFSHNDSVNSVKLVETSAFGGEVLTIALTGCTDGYIRVFNAHNGCLYKTIASNMPGIASQCSIELLESNGEFIVGCGDDFSVRVWALLTDSDIVHFLPGHNDEIQQLKVVGNLAITCCWDATMRVWNISKGFCLQTLSTPNDPLMCCSFGEGLIIGGSGEGHVHVWHASTFKHFFSMPGHIGEVYCIGINDDVIVSGGADSSVRMYSHSGVEAGVFSGVHVGIVRYLRMLKHRAVTAGDRKVIAIWDTKMKCFLTVIHRNPTLISDIWCDDTKIITASPDSPGTLSIISFW